MEGITSWKGEENERIHRGIIRGWLNDLRIL